MQPLHVNNMHMKKFIVLYHASAAAQEQMGKGDEEAAKEGMKAWMAWAEKCGDALVDLGNPLGNAQKVSEGGAAASDSSVAGYSVVQAEDMEGAVALMDGHPHLGWHEGCDIEIHEALPLPA